MTRNEVYQEIKNRIADESNIWLLVSMLSLDRIKEVLIEFDKVQTSEDNDKRYRSTTLINQNIKTKLFDLGGLIGVTLNISACEISVAAIEDLGHRGKEPGLAEKELTKFTEKMVIVTDSRLGVKRTDYYKYDIFEERHMPSPENLDNLKKIICKRYYYTNTTKYGNKNINSLTYQNDIYSINRAPKIQRHNEVMLKQKGRTNPVDGFILNLNPKYVGDLFHLKEEIVELLNSYNKPLHVYILDEKLDSYIKSYPSVDAIVALHKSDFLNEFGFDIDQQDEKGKTALHYAVLNKDLELVKYLLSINANISIQDNMNKTPMAFNTETIELMQSAEDYFTPTEESIHEQIQTLLAKASGSIVS
jgi:hypothetical protein